MTIMESNQSNSWIGVCIALPGNMNKKIKFGKGI